MNRRVARLEYDVLWLAVRLYGFGASLEVGPARRWSSDLRAFQVCASVKRGREETAVETMARGPVGVLHALRGLKRSLTEELARREKSRRWLGLTREQRRETGASS